MFLTRCLTRSTISRFTSKRLISTSVSVQFPSQPIDLEEIQNNKKDAILIDVREKAELENHGIVEGAVNIPFGAFDEVMKMNNDQFKDVTGIDKPAQDQKLIFFCVKGIRAKTGADLAADKFKFSNSYFYKLSFKDLQ